MFVNGEYVDDELIRIEAASLREQVREQMPGCGDLEINVRARNLARENVIERVLLRMAAQQDRTPIAPGQIEGALQQYARNAAQSKCMLPAHDHNLRASVELDLRIERLTTRIAANAGRPKPRDIKEYYNQNKASFYTPELVRAAHIVKNVDETACEHDALAAIRTVQTLLKDGANFEELADQFSDCPGRGGDLGFFPRNEMVEEFEAVVFGLAPGETSEIFRSRFGFHIVKLYERRPARFLSVDEVRGDIEKLLWDERRREMVRSYIAELRCRAEIQRSSPASPGPAA